MYDSICVTDTGTEWSLSSKCCALINQLSEIESAELVTISRWNIYLNKLDENEIQKRMKGYRKILM